MKLTNTADAGASGVNGHLKDVVTLSHRHGWIHKQFCRYSLMNRFLEILIHCNRLISKQNYFVATSYTDICNLKLPWSLYHRELHSVHSRRALHLLHCCIDKCDVSSAVCAIDDVSTFEKEQTIENRRQSCNHYNAKHYTISNVHQDKQLIRPHVQNVLSRECYINQAKSYHWPIKVLISKSPHYCINRLYIQPCLVLLAGPTVSRRVYNTPAEGGATHWKPHPLYIQATLTTAHSTRPHERYNIDHRTWKPATNDT